MQNLKKLVSLCKGSVDLSINPHKDNYKSVVDYMQDVFLLDHDVIDEIGEEIYQKMVETDTIILLQAYPETPIGFYLTYHYDLDMAIDIVLKSILNNKS